MQLYVCLYSNTLFVPQKAKVIWTHLYVCLKGDDLLVLHTFIKILCEHLLTLFQQYITCPPYYMKIYIPLYISEAICVSLYHMCEYGLIYIHAL